MPYFRQEVLMMIQRKKRFLLSVTPAEEKLVQFCLFELRNKLLASGHETEDIDALLRKIIK